MYYTYICILHSIFLIHVAFISVGTHSQCPIKLLCKLAFSYTYLIITFLSFFQNPLLAQKQRSKKYQELLAVCLCQLTGELPKAPHNFYDLCF